MEKPIPGLQYSSFIGYTFCSAGIGTERFIIHLNLRGNGKVSHDSLPQAMGKLLGDVLEVYLKVFLSSQVQGGPLGVVLRIRLTVVQVSGYVAHLETFRVHKVPLQT